MLRFNLSLSQMLSLISVSTVMTLTACSLPKPQQGSEEQSAATFYKDNSKVEYTGQTLNAKISLPEAKTFNFNVCLRDNKYKKAVENHEFHVSGEGVELQDKTLTSDANGCIFWSEAIAYNHLADAKLVEIRRSITANGFHKGTRVVTFAINPWENTAYALGDTEVKNLIPASEAKAALQGLDKSLAAKKTAIWFDDLRLTVDEKQINNQGLVLNFEIRALPNFVYSKVSGQRVMEPVTYGEFEGELSLIHVVSENQKEVRRYLQRPVAIKGSMANNYLFLESRLTLDRICTRGQVQLGLKLKAIGAPENLVPFEGVFIVGECDQIKGNTFSRLKNVFQEGQGSLTIDGYLTDKTSTTDNKPRNSSDSQTSTDTSQQDAYQLGQVEIKRLRFENVAFQNKGSFHRRKTFNVQACMKTGLDQKSLRAQSFQVIKVNGETESIRSNDDGCISWDDTLDFNYLDKECWSQKTIQIGNANLGVNQTLKINVNPWAEGQSSLRDIRFLNQTGQQLTCADGLAEIMIPSYSFDKKEYAYDVNSALQLKVKKTGLFRINPTLKRPSLTEPSGYEQTSLPVGPYILKYAVVDNLVKDFSKASRKIFQASEKLVFVTAGGVISELLTLETWNAKALGNTNQLLLELIPAKADAAQILKARPEIALTELQDSTSSMHLQTFTAPLIMANNNEGASAVALDDSTRPKQNSLVDALKKQLALDVVAFQKENTALSTKEVLAKNENLQIVNVNNEAENIPLRKSLQSPVWWYPDTTEKQKATAPVELYKLKQPLYEKGLNSDIASRLCAYWFFDRLRRPVKTIQVQRHPKTGQPGPYDITAIPGYLPSSYQLTTICQTEVMTDFSKWFDIQQRFFITNVTKVEDLNPQIRDFGIQTSFSMSKGHSDAITKSRSWDMNIGASFAPKIGFFGASIGGGFRASISNSSTDSDAYGTSVSFSSGVSGTIERLAFKLHSENVEKCTIIKLNPAVYLDLKKAPVPMMMDPRLTDAEKMKVLTEGLMICQGAPQIAKMDFIETYFILNQKMAIPQATDTASEASRPFFVSLRGQRDFDAFMGYLHGSFGIPNSAQGSYQTKEAYDDRLSNAFLKGIRSYPGQYISPE